MLEEGTLKEIFEKIDLKKINSEVEIKNLGIKLFNKLFKTDI